MKLFKGGDLVEFSKMKTIIVHFVLATPFFKKKSTFLVLHTNNIYMYGCLFQHCLYFHKALNPFPVCQ